MAEYVGEPGGDVAEEIDVDLEPPTMYRVLMHNDNFTTMDFVIEVLRTVFRKSEQDAVQIMLHVHERGVGMCGVYPRDIAEMKIAEVHERAQAEEFPLRCTMEPE